MRSQRRPARIRVGRGPLDTERLLLEEVSRRLEELGEEVLARPILIVVPSLSLRAHLLSRLADRWRRGVAGVACRTLHGLATELVDRGSGSLPGEVDLFPLFARRAAQRETSLRRSLEHLRDGYGAVVGAVRDLLDAGLDPAHAEALDEVLSEEGRGAASQVEVARARGLVRVAVATSQAVEASGGGRSSTLLRQAADLLRTQAEGLPQPGALLVHGFADATGVATDLLEALLEVLGGILFLDHPPDPAQPGLSDPGIAFARRFCERLQAVARLDPATDCASPSPRIDLFRALGGEAEVREAARRIRKLLDAGQRPETLALVARNLDPYRTSLRRHLRRLGVPFSSFGTTGPRSPDGRRLQALLDLLRDTRRTPVDRWLDASAWRIQGAALHDLRLALFSLGAGRLEQAAELKFEDFLEGGHYALPARRGFSETDRQPDHSEATDTEVRLRRRRVPAAALRGVVEAAARLCRLLQRWGEPQPASEHLARLRRLLLDHLEWPAEEDLTRTVLSELEGLAQELPVDLSIDFDEYTRLLRDRLRDLGRVDLGGRGAGVQILEVTEARGWTFEHLFLLGLNRGVFPRAVREDPMFPDSLRRVIGRQGHGVLPDLPLKLGGFDEERYLFAQLLASSPNVTLSWQVVDDDNAALTPSPLIERLRWSDTQRALLEARVAPDLLALPEADGAAAEGEWLATATESSVLVALHGGRRRLAQVLPLALAEADDSPDTAPDSIEPPSSADAERLTRARLRVLDEMDPVRGTGPGESTRARLGPYFGFVGEIAESDPRGHQPLYVTTLERLSGCPWQTFLERVLRIERFPDPLEILPGVDPPMVGDLVHRVLEQVVRQRLPEPAADLAAAHGTEAGAIPWPPEGELARVLQREAERVVRDHGIGLPGLPGILAQRVAPHLEAARDLEWSSGEGVPAVAVECHGELEVQDDRSDPQRLHFKADRLDRLPEGLRLSDYKTGRAISSSSRASTRRRELLRAVSSGGWLQAVAYALAAGGPNDSGRYLFLGPDLPPDPELRSVDVRADDGELVAAFQRAVRILLGAWRSGHFFPRLVEPDRDQEPSRCGYCAVAEACLRGDSGSRARLRDWAHRAGQRFLQEPMDLPSADRPLVAAWLLPSKHLSDESAGEEAGS